MAFEISLRRDLGGRAIALECRAEARLIALIGPSGVGKTSILNMVAGLLRPDHGRIVVDGRLLFDSAAGVDLPPAQRHAGYLFQDRRLFPHMRVEANLRYGRRPGGTLEMDGVIALLGIGHLLHRWPDTLSGGEAQRVALGRVLLSAPHFLLMDEPLSGLDRSRRDEILPLIETLRDQIRLPILYVTHDHREAERLADLIVEMPEA
ncbi:molybdate transport system ATP-binding protein [Sphingobium sp. OAS761]|uniref:ATP-binding cassette domain-containing protein n=1 Tax=Sphingobium sp. OAS761 TaxID=2817901 RepID=UPI0020A171E1|nr:ATP-binding cassette domain-containing protein [Sphingobium sp. OAS761]MCP1468499.1 molybdate transport system ATP-binding protein [Sphingobium sp. OAS761]